MAAVESQLNKLLLFYFKAMGSLIMQSEKFVGRILALPFNAVIYPVKPSSWRKSWSERWGDCKNGLSHVISGHGNDSLCDRFGINFVKIFTYPTKPPNWFKSGGELWHDMKNGGHYIIGKPHGEGYDSPIQTTKSSKYLGVQVIRQEKGKVTFLASRILTGDVPYLTPEELDKIKGFSKDRSSKLTIFKGENKIVIEVDIKDIINKVKAAPENKGKNPEEIKQLVFGKVYDEVDQNLKGLAKITGGELKVHTDRKLLYGITEKLCMEYDDQKQLSSEIVGSVGERKSSEEFLSNWQSKVREQDLKSCESIKSRGLML